MYIQADCIFQTLLIFHRTDFERIVSRRQIGVSNRSARSLGPHLIRSHPDNIQTNDYGHYYN